MRFEGDVTIKAPLARVWEFLTDPRQASQCAPNLERLDVLDDRRFRAVGTAGVGPIKGAYTVEAMWMEREAPTRGRLRARGKAPGITVDAEVVMVLTEVKQSTTLLRWEAQVAAKGIAALAGSRVLSLAVDQATEAAFSCVKAKLKASAATQPAPGG